MADLGSVDRFACLKLVLKQQFSSFLTFDYIYMDHGLPSWIDRKGGRIMSCCTLPFFTNILSTLFTENMRTLMLTGYSTRGYSAAVPCQFRAPARVL